MEVLTPFIPDLDIGEKWGLSYTAQPLYSWGKSPCSPSNGRLGQPHCQAGCFGQEKSLLSVTPPLYSP